MVSATEIVDVLRCTCTLTGEVEHAIEVLVESGLIEDLSRTYGDLAHGKMTMATAKKDAVAAEEVVVASEPCFSMLFRIVKGLFGRK